MFGSGHRFRMFRPGGIQPIRRNLAQHAAVLEAPARIGGRAGQACRRVPDEVEHVAVVVRALREVAGALERCRHAEAGLVPPPLTLGPVLVRVEEEQFVLPAGFADRAANRIAAVVLVREGLGDAVADVRPRVGIPPRVALDVVHRSAELVRSALGHGGDLQPARPAVLRLIAGGEHLDLGDCVHVGLQHLAVVARVHDRHAVHHEVVGVVLPGIAQPRGSAHAGRKGGERGEVAVGNRQVLDRLGGGGEGAFAALRLNHWRLARHGDGFSKRAHLDYQGPDRYAITRTDAHVRPLQRLEPVHRHLDGVGVSRDVRENEVTAFVGQPLGGRALRLADERYRSAGNRAALRVVDGTRHGAGRLRERRRSSREEPGDSQHRDSECAHTRSHTRLLNRCDMTHRDVIALMSKSRNIPPLRVAARAL